MVTFTLSQDMPDNTEPQQEKPAETTFHLPIDSQAKLITIELREQPAQLKVSTDQNSPTTEQVLIETTKSLDTHANQEITVQLSPLLGQTTRIYEIWYAIA